MFRGQCHFQRPAVMKSDDIKLNLWYDVAHVSSYLLPYLHGLNASGYREIIRLAMQVCYNDLMCIINRTLQVNVIDG